MNFSTLLLLGSGMWGVGLESIHKPALPPLHIASVPHEWDSSLFQISAPSVLVTESESLTPLFQKNAKTRVSMASLTKIMTALIIFEYHDLQEQVTISKAPAFTEGSSMRLKEGEILTVEDLLYGLLLKSGNDSAVALAQYHSGTVHDFVDEMNTKARDLHLIDTHFQNPHGLDSPSHYSTPHDMAKLAKVFIQHPTLKKIVSTPSITITSKDGKHEHFLENTNKLLGQGFFVSGIKTGTTENAGECLLLFVENGKNKYFMVIMGSEDRYTDAKTLLFQLLGKEVL